MITAGVDLAAEAAGTAVAVLEWDGLSARVISLRLGIADAGIVETALVARAVAHHATEPARNPSTADAEGWIHLPTGPLEALPADNAGGA